MKISLNTALEDPSKNTACSSGCKLKKELELECVHRNIIEMITGTETFHCERKLREIGLFSLAK